MGKIKISSTLLDHWDFATHSLHQWGKKISNGKASGSWRHHDDGVLDKNTLKSQDQAWLGLLSSIPYENWQVACHLVLLLHMSIRKRNSYTGLMCNMMISVGSEWDEHDPGVHGISCHSLWPGPGLHWIGSYTNLDQRGPRFPPLASPPSSSSTQQDCWG